MKYTIDNTDQDNQTVTFTIVPDCGNKDHEYTDTRGDLHYYDETIDKVWIEKDVQTILVPEKADAEGVITGEHEEKIETDAHWQAIKPYLKRHSRDVSAALANYAKEWNEAHMSEDEHVRAAEDAPNPYANVRVKK